MDKTYDSASAASGSQDTISADVLKDDFHSVFVDGGSGLSLTRQVFISHSCAFFALRNSVFTVAVVILWPAPKQRFERHAKAQARGSGPQLVLFPCGKVKWHQPHSALISFVYTLYRIPANPQQMLRRLYAGSC